MPPGKQTSSVGPASQSDSTMECRSHNSTGNTIMFATDSINTSEDINCDSEIGDSVVSYNFSSISNKGLMCYIYSSDGDEEDDASLVPKWKDDGDDSIICSSIDNQGDGDIENNIDIESDTDSYELSPIPSTLEFSVLQNKTDGERHPQPPASPSSVSYTQYSSSHLRRIDMAQDEFPSLSLISMPSDFRSETTHSDGDTCLDQVASDMKSTERRNGFRRRLHTNMDIGSTDANPLSESSQSSSPSPSMPSSPPSRYSIFSRSRSRFVLMFGAMVLVLLSVHDNVKSSRQYYRQQDQLLSSDINWREEVFLPLVQVTNGAGRKKEETNTISHHHPPKAELPKFYFPKNDHPNTNWIRGSTSAGRSGSNLLMARSQQSRPIFVPDTPLPDGGFRKPLERFVFDQTDGPPRSDRRVFDNDNSSSSLTSWIASLTLIGMLFDTGYKEYRRYRITAMPSLRDE